MIQVFVLPQRGALQEWSNVLQTGQEDTGGCTGDAHREPSGSDSEPCRNFQDIMCTWLHPCDQDMVEILTKFVAQKRDVRIDTVLQVPGSLQTASNNTQRVTSTY
jgi:hypothetical protein